MASGNLAELALTRQLEERDVLIRNLRGNVDALLDQLADAAARNETLKRVQDVLTRDKLGAERHVESLMQEKAELASENARLHIFAKEARALAERATRIAHEQQRFADARAQADELLLAAASPPPTQSDEVQPIPAIELREVQAQMHSLKLVLARVLQGLGASGLQLDRVALLAPERPETRGALERALRHALLPLGGTGSGDSDAHSRLISETAGALGADRRSGAGISSTAPAGTLPMMEGAPISTTPTSFTPAAATHVAAIVPAGAVTGLPSALPSAASVTSTAAEPTWGLGSLISHATWGFWAVLVGDQSDEAPPAAGPQLASGEGVSSNAPKLAEGSGDSGGPLDPEKLSAARGAPS